MRRLVAVLVLASCLLLLAVLWVGESAGGFLGLGAEEAASAVGHAVPQAGASTGGATLRGSPGAGTPTSKERYRDVTGVDESRHAADVRGRVTFPDGSPAAALAVTIEPASGPRTTVLTDAQGIFRVEAGRGPVRVALPSSAGSRVLTERGAGEAAFAFARHRTHVRVRDEAGRPLSGSDVGFREIRQGRDPIGRAPVSRTDGSVDFFFEPGTRVIVAGHLDGYVPAEAELVVPWQPWNTDVDLVLAKQTLPLGRLRVDVRRPDGAPMQDVHVVLLTPLARSRRRRGGDLRPDAEGVIDDVPPGRWVLSITGDGNGGYAYDGYLFAVRAEAVVKPNATTDVHARSRTGGRIRLVADLQGEAAEPPTAEVRFAPGRLPPTFSEWVDASETEPVLSRLVEPGPWTLQVRGEDVEPRDLTVDVAAGQTTPVTIPLVPR